MSSPGYYKQGKKLEEGSIYSFKYTKLVTLSDNNEYMILEDLYGIRHTVPYDNYRNYGLVLDNIIECKVDKVNCTGRVFLEPKHPLYREGEIYNFAVNSVILTNGGNVLKIFDCFNNIIEARVNIDLMSSKRIQKVEARIIKISRGQPELDILSIL